MSAVFSDDAAGNGSVPVTNLHSVPDVNMPFLVEKSIEKQCPFTRRRLQITQNL